MGKINKYANIYDKQGNLVRRVAPDGRMRDYTVEELEELVDKLANDKDENGKIKDPRALNNANSILMQYYSTKRGAHRLSELLAQFKEAAEKSKVKQRPMEEQIVDAMNELKESVEQEESADEIVHKVESNVDEEYVDFEDVKEDEKHD